MKISKKTYEEIEKKAACTNFVCTSANAGPDVWAEFVKRAVRFDCTDGRIMYVHSSGYIVAEAPVSGGAYRFYGAWAMDKAALAAKIKG